MKMTMNANIPARDSDMTRAVPNMNKQAKPMYFIVLDLFSNGKQNGMLEAMQAAKPAGLSKLPEILKLVLKKKIYNQCTIPYISFIRQIKTIRIIIY